MRDIWNKLKHFNENENWGDTQRISEELLLQLDAFRSYIDQPIVISRGTQGKSDAKKSQHPHGRAVDVVFPEINKNGKSLENIFIDALRFDFTGIGIYRFWGYQGLIVGGLHLDVRERSRFSPKSLWECVILSGKRKYVGVKI